jgi:transposase
MRGVPFDVEKYVKAVESYESGAESVDEIVRETGISEPSFFRKLREYREKEGRIDPPRRQGSPLKRTKEFNKALKKLKRGHPDYGCDRLTRELEKMGYSVSVRTTSNALSELNLQLPPKRGASTARR